MKYKKILICFLVIILFTIQLGNVPVQAKNSKIGAAYIEAADQIKVADKLRENGFTGADYTEILENITRNWTGFRIAKGDSNALRFAIEPRQPIDWAEFKSFYPSFYSLIYTPFEFNIKHPLTYDVPVFLGIDDVSYPYYVPVYYKTDVNVNTSVACELNVPLSDWFAFADSFSDYADLNIVREASIGALTYSTTMISLQSTVTSEALQKQLKTYIGEMAMRIFENDSVYATSREMMRDWCKAYNGSEPTDDDLYNFAFELFTAPAYSYTMRNGFWKKMLDVTNVSLAERFNHLSSLSAEYFSNATIGKYSVFGTYGVFNGTYAEAVRARDISSDAWQLKVMGKMYNVITGLGTDIPGMINDGSLSYSSSYTDFQRFFIFSLLGTNHTAADVKKSEEEFLYSNFSKVCEGLVNKDGLLLPSSAGVDDYKNWFIYIVKLCEGVDLAEKTVTLNISKSDTATVVNYLIGNYSSDLASVGIDTDEKKQKIAETIIEKIQNQPSVKVNDWAEFSVQKLCSPKSYGLKLSYAQISTLLSMLYTSNSVAAQTDPSLPSKATCAARICASKTDDTNSTELAAYAAENIVEGLEEFKKINSSTTGALYTKEMLSYSSRVKYLLGFLGQQLGVTLDSDDLPTLYELDPDIIEFHKNNLNSESEVIKVLRENELLLVPDASTANPADYSKVAYPDGISYAPYGKTLVPTGASISGEDAMTAYSYLMDTALELKAYQCILIKELQNLMDADNLPSVANQYIYALKSIYDGLVLLNSDAMWDIWYNKPDQSLYPGLHTESLSELYNTALAANLFATDMEYTDIVNDSNPLNKFFDVDSKTLSSNIAKGIAYSASYIPMHTNIYDPYTLVQCDSKFLNEFHYKYGFNRKVLYRDKSANAAMNYFTNGSKGTTCVCTLADLLNSSNDLVLYIDSNLYNVDILENKLNIAYGRSAETQDQTIWSSFTEALSALMSIDIHKVTKTGSYAYYSDELYANYIQGVDTEKYVSGKYTVGADGKGVVENCDNNGNYILTSGYIDKYLDSLTYDVMKSYAVVSAIYRYAPLYQLCSRVTAYTRPVFISSNRLVTASSASGQLKNTIFNYAIVQNLTANIPVDYRHNVDMNSPLYMDVYGNILTESGVVVIPAASNATLFTEDYRSNIYNLGFYSTYGDAYSITTKTVPKAYASVLENVLGESEDGVYHLLDNTVGSSPVLLSNVSTEDTQFKEVLQAAELQCVTAGMVDFDTLSMVCLEVLRGAPLESLDKDKEGVSSLGSLDSASLEAAAKLDVVVKQFDTSKENTNLSIGSLVHIDGIEYIIVIAVKSVIAIMVVVMLVIIYLDSVSYRLSGRTFWKCASVIFLTVLCITAVPALFELTYYGANRLLLQDETELIATLNQEKNMNGVEIGITDITPPTESSNILLRLEDIRLPWYELLNKTLFSDAVTTVQEYVQQEIAETGLADYPRAQIYRDGVYISTQDLFDSSVVYYNDATKEIYQTSTEEIPATYYTPYYLFLDTILAKINAYNSENNVYAYSVKYQEGGRFSTVGLITPYFDSEEFIDDKLSDDLLSLYKVYQIPEQLVTDDIFSEDILTEVRKSGWYSTITDQQQLVKRINLITEEARNFVMENRQMLGSVTDETFVKALALHLAIYHNQLMGYSHCDGYEIYQISNTDLLRMSTADHYSVITNSALTYPRFVAESGGAMSVYAAALLIVTNWLESKLTPILVVAIFLLTFVSIFIFRVCLRRKDNNLLGYIIILISLCAVNILRAVGFKLTVLIAQSNASATVCIIITCVVKIVYLFVLSAILSATLSDWRTLGVAKYTKKALGFLDGLYRLPARMGNTLHRHSTNYHRGYGPDYLDNRGRRYDYDNWTYYREMRESQDRRYQR